MATEIIRAGVEHSSLLPGIVVAAKGHWGYPQAWLAAWGDRVRIPPEYVVHNEVWLAAADGQIAGFYGLKLEGDLGILDHLWVIPGRIGLGHGRALFEHAVQRAVVRGATFLEWESDRNAVPFYQRMGGRRLRETRTAMEHLLPVMGMGIPPK